MKMIKIKLNVPTDSFISNLCCRCHKELKFTQIFGIGIDGYFCEICSNNECSSYTGKLICIKCGVINNFKGVKISPKTWICENCEKKEGENV